jgi:citrate synthase
MHAEANPSDARLPIHISAPPAEDRRRGRRAAAIKTLTDQPIAVSIYAVLFGDTPSATRLPQFENYLWHAGSLPPDVAQAVRAAARLGAHPSTTLQSVAPLLALEAPELRCDGAATIAEGLLIAARLPAAIASIRAALEGHPEPQYPSLREYGARTFLLIAGPKFQPDNTTLFARLFQQELLNDREPSTATARTVATMPASASAAIAAALSTLHVAQRDNPDSSALHSLGVPEEFAVATRAAARVFDWVAQIDAAN